MTHCYEFWRLLRFARNDVTRNDGTRNDVTRNDVIRNDVNRHIAIKKSSGSWPAADCGKSSFQSP